MNTRCAHPRQTMERFTRSARAAMVKSAASRLEALGGGFTDKEVCRLAFFRWRLDTGRASHDAASYRWRGRLSERAEPGTNPLADRTI